MSTSRVPDARAPQHSSRRTAAAAAAAAPLLQLHLGCEFQYQTAAGTEFVILVEPPDQAARAQVLHAERRVTPDLPLRLSVAAGGARCWRVTASSPELAFRYAAVVAVPDRPDDVPLHLDQLAPAALPDAVLPYTRPSRFCQSDLLQADAWRLFGDVPTGCARVQAICAWVHAGVTYSAAQSGPTTSAVDTLASRTGVCRDFAHLAITFCRALNIPARYAFGYLPDYGVPPAATPMDFHAWFEAYLGDGWYPFDARHNVPRIGRVKVGHGRDAVDVALVTSFGAATLTSLRVWADARPGDRFPTDSGSCSSVDASGASIGRAAARAH
jgi:transglutaminase-like putative cysteine protease